MGIEAQGNAGTPFYQGYCNRCAIDSLYRFFKHLHQYRHVHLFEKCPLVIHRCPKTDTFGSVDARPQAGPEGLIFPRSVRDHRRQRAGSPFYLTFQVLMINMVKKNGRSSRIATDIEDGRPPTRCSVPPGPNWHTCCMDMENERCMSFQD